MIHDFQGGGGGGFLEREKAQHLTKVALRHKICVLQWFMQFLPTVPRRGRSLIHHRLNPAGRGPWSPFMSGEMFTARDCLDVGVYV